MYWTMLNICWDSHVTVVAVLDHAEHLFRQSRDCCCCTGPCWTSVQTVTWLLLLYWTMLNICSDNHVTVVAVLDHAEHLFRQSRDWYGCTGPCWTSVRDYRHVTIVLVPVLKYSKYMTMYDYIWLYVLFISSMDCWSCTGIFLTAQNLQLSCDWMIHAKQHFSQFM